MAKKQWVTLAFGSEWSFCFKGCKTRIVTKAAKVIKFFGKELFPYWSEKNVRVI
jgi:hypothetical protein